MKLQPYTGDYYFMGFMLRVREAKGRLEASIPGVPAGFEASLHPLEGDRFRMQGGPSQGSTVEFQRDDSGRVTKMVIANTYPMSRVTPEEAAALPVTQRRTAPALNLDPQKEAAFEGLIEWILAGAPGKTIDYALPYPRHEFVQYAMQQGRFIFHGSNNRSIDLFTPTRLSAELYDVQGRGNLAALYGSQDGLWSMFFAIVDRERLRGSIRNGVMHIYNPAGDMLPLYNFSINAEQLAEQPWTPGALYFFKMESFERLMLTDTDYSNEWACYQPVQALARLDVEPEDFPFLAQIEGHDDSEGFRAEEVSRQVHAAAISATLENARFTVTVNKDPETAKALEEYVEIHQRRTPAAQFSIRDDGEVLTLVMDQLPPAVQHLYRRSYQSFLEP